MTVAVNPIIYSFWKPKSCKSSTKHVSRLSFSSPPSQWNLYNTNICIIMYLCIHYINKSGGNQRQDKRRTSTRKSFRPKTSSSLSCHFLSKIISCFCELLLSSRSAIITVDKRKTFNISFLYIGSRHIHRQKAEGKEKTSYMFLAKTMIESLVLT